MLGIEHTVIYCDVVKCRYNEKHKVRSGQTGKVIETYFTCEKETLFMNDKGKCKECK